MIASHGVVPMKLHIKCPSRMGECRRQFLHVTDKLGLGSSVNAKECSKMGKSHTSKETLNLQGANKRGPPDLIESPPEKRQKRNPTLTQQKMNHTVAQQCSLLLKSLMTHKSGWPFTVPVDPVKLKIPDYPSIIKKPMDLGTIKSKLQKNVYSDTSEFASDIRLTFSNAILYNPPENYVHQMAVKLNEFFERSWKSLEDKWNVERIKSGNDKLLRQPSTKSCDAKRSKISEKNVMTSSLNGRACEVKVAKPAEKSVHKSLDQHLHKGTDAVGRLACGSINKKPLMSPVDARYPSDSCHTTSDISSERLSGRDHHTCRTNACRDQDTCRTNTSRKDCEAKSILRVHSSKSDPDSDGAVSAVEDESICHSSQHAAPATDAASEEGWKDLYDAQLSPSKVLRAAMLKRRFADTIAKAQQKTLLVGGAKADPAKLWQEKERLERVQREEKARLEAQIRAAEAASRMRQQEELKKQREREREAARAAVEKVEKTANIELNLDVLKELEKLCGCPLTYNINFWGGSNNSRGARFRSPLERLGLFFKEDDFPDEVEDEIFDGCWEEGEILCC